MSERKRLTIVLATCVNAAQELALALTHADVNSKEARLNILRARDHIVSARTDVDRYVYDLVRTLPTRKE